MKEQPPSIFNDVIGPVMRGPSSSHTAASVRIGNLVRQFFNGQCVDFRAEFASDGSLAATYKSQGSAIGLIGGLLGMDTDDPLLDSALENASKAGLKITFNVVDFKAEHPNTYRITAGDSEGKYYRLLFISSGGGMIELKAVNNFPLSLKGDLYETLFFFKETEFSDLEKIKDTIKNEVSDYIDFTLTSADHGGLINLKTAYLLDAQKIAQLVESLIAVDVVTLKPIMPIMARKAYELPFSTAVEMITKAEKGPFPLWKLALDYEKARGGMDEEAIFSRAEKIYAAMKGSVSEGLAGTDYGDRILGAQASKYLETKRSLIGNNLNRLIIAYTAAVMETKSAMGLIVAAPTAGSCGVIPGTIFAVAEEYDLKKDDLIKAILAAGIIGVLIAGQSTFAAEECGCQAECGSASAMTAGALVQMFGGSVAESLGAASIALQNILGLICDPVANRVEVPCLGKNILCGLNAVAAADMVMGNFDPLIPLDEAILAMDQVGRLLPAELRCTNKGGLSITKTAETIANRLDHRE